MNYNNWIIPIILVLILGGFYFGLKIKVFFPLTQKWQKVSYWIIIYLFTSVSFLFRTIVTGFLLYFLVLSFIYDFIHYLFKNMDKVRNILEKLYFKGIPFMFISIVVTLYGAYNLHNPVIKEYNVSLNNLKNDLTIGMITDLHLGILHDEDVFTKMIEQANSFQADIFVLNGDIFDEYTSKDLKELAYDKFSKIKTKYGIYFIEGNHDLLTEETRNGFESHNIHVLDDEVITIADSINLIGRKDYRNNKIGNKRKELEELLENIDNSLPTVVVDHQPVDQSKAKKLGINLQLSGHTHGGQIFPGNFLLQYGHKKDGNYQIIVSSGYGAWAFPLRTAGHSEIVKINLKKS